MSVAEEPVSIALGEPVDRCLPGPVTFRHKTLVTDAEFEWGSLRVLTVANLAKVMLTEPSAPFGSSTTASSIVVAWTHPIQVCLLSELPWEDVG